MTLQEKLDKELESKASYHAWMEQKKETFVKEKVKEKKMKERQEREKEREKEEKKREADKVGRKQTDDMSLVARKPVFRISDQVRLKPACSAKETS